jgi:hypothetical protein
MTLVNAETGEIVEVLTEREARSLTERIRVLLDGITNQTEKVIGLIHDAQQGQAWAALGYRSWTEYAAREFADAFPRLTKVEQISIAAELSAMGMSLRAVSAVTSVPKSTIADNLAGVRDRTPDAPETPEPEETPDLGPTAPGRAAETGVVDPPPAPAPIADSTPRPVTGIDGKTYTRPTPAPTPQPHLAPVVYEAEWDEQDRAEELASNLARNISLLFALTVPERRAEFIDTWHRGVDHRPVLGQNFVTPGHMRRLSEALATFAHEWELADV